MLRDCPCSTPYSCIKRIEHVWKGMSNDKVRSRICLTCPAKAHYRPPARDLCRSTGRVRQPIPRLPLLRRSGGQPLHATERPPRRAGSRPTPAAPARRSSGETATDAEWGEAGRSGAGSGGRRTAADQGAVTGPPGNLVRIHSFRPYHASSFRMAVARYPYPDPRAVARRRAAAELGADRQLLSER